MATLTVKHHLRIFYTFCNCYSLLFWHFPGLIHTHMYIYTHILCHAQLVKALPNEIWPVHPKGNQSWIFIGRTDAEAETSATWCKELTHLKRPWCWERLRAGGEGDDRGWDGWMASPTQWTWVSKPQELATDREAWRATVLGVAKSRTWLSD